MTAKQVSVNKDTFISPVRRNLDSRHLQLSEKLHTVQRLFRIMQRTRILEWQQIAFKDVVYALTVLPESVIADVLAQKEMVRRLHDAELADGFGSVWLPYAFERIGTQALSTEATSF